MAKIDLLTPGRQELGQVTIPCPQAAGSVAKNHSLMTCWLKMWERAGACGGLTDRYARASRYVCVPCASCAQRST